MDWLLMGLLDRLHGINFLVPDPLIYLLPTLSKDNHLIEGYSKIDFPGSFYYLGKKFLIDIIT